MHTLLLFHTIQSQLRASSRRRGVPVERVGVLPKRAERRRPALLQHLHQPLVCTPHKQPSTIDRERWARGVYTFHVLHQLLTPPATPSLPEWLEQHSPDSSKNRAAAYMLWYSAQKRSRKNAAVSGRTPAR